MNMIIRAVLLAALAFGIVSNLTGCTAEVSPPAPDTDAGADTCTVYPPDVPASGDCIPVSAFDGGGQIQCCRGAGDPLACLSGCEAASDTATIVTFTLR